MFLSNRVAMINGEGFLGHTGGLQFAAATCLLLVSFFDNSHTLIASNTAAVP